MSFWTTAAWGARVCWGRRGRTTKVVFQRAELQRLQGMRKPRRSHSYKFRIFSCSRKALGTRSGVKEAWRSSQFAALDICSMRRAWNSKLSHLPFNSMALSVSKRSWGSLSSRGVEGPWVSVDQPPPPTSIQCRPGESLLKALVKEVPESGVVHLEDHL